MSMPESPSPRRVVWIAVAFGVLAVGLVLALVLVRNADDGPGESGGSGDPATRPTLVLPESAAGYTLLTTAAAEEYAADSARDLKEQAPQGEVTVGTYVEGDGQLVLVGFAFPAQTDQGEALDTDPANALGDYFEAAGIAGAEPYDAGPLGGVLLCGDLAAGAGGADPQVVCGWADGGTLGTLRFASGPLADGPAGDAAAVTLEFRDAAEQTGSGS